MPTRVCRNHGGGYFTNEACGGCGYTEITLPDKASQRLQMLYEQYLQAQDMVRTHMRCAREASSRFLQALHEEALILQQAEEATLTTEVHSERR